MNKKEIINLFYDELNPHFNEWGFKLYKSKLKALMKQGQMVKTIFFDANYFIGKASMQPYFWIRNNEIMQIRAKVNVHFDNDHFVTINKHLSEVCQSFERSDLDFSQVTHNNGDGGLYFDDKTMLFFKEHFIKFMDEVGLRFFETFYTHKDFDRWFNEELFDGKYEGVKINQDTVPMYSYISAYITGNKCVEDIYNYWMSYKNIYSEAKEEITLVREYLRNDYQP